MLGLCRTDDGNRMRLSHLRLRADLFRSAARFASARGAAGWADAIVVASVAVSLIVSTAFWVRAVGVILLWIVAIDLAAIKLRSRGSVPLSASRAERIERGFAEAPIGMMVMSTDLEVASVNDALCAVLGRDADALVGHSVREFTHPDDIERTDQKRLSLLRHEDTGPVHKRYLRADGTVVAAVVTAVLIEPQDSPPFILSQLQDVTEQRRVERQNAAIADLGHAALRSTDVIALMDEAMTLVRDTLEMRSASPLVGSTMAASRSSPPPEPPATRRSQSVRTRRPRSRLRASSRSSATTSPRKRASPSPTWSSSSRYRRR